MKVTAAYAKANLPELLKAVEKGERVTISRYRKPVADLVPSAEAAKPARKLGTGKDLNVIIDPNWHKAIETQEELEEFLKGNF
jgi:prevent-host-death family protein